MPIVLLRRGQVPLRYISALYADPRLEVLATDNLTATWIGIAQRACAVFVATVGNPLNALIFTITANIRVPIVVVHARGYRGMAADLGAVGAFGTLTAPVEAKALAALVRLLRPQAGSVRVDRALHMTLDPIARTIRYRDACLSLSPRQYAILHALTTHDGRAVSADDLITLVWGTTPSADRTRQGLDVYMCQLRRKFAAAGLEGIITTIRGYGYALHAVQQTRDQSPIPNLGPSMG